MFVTATANKLDQKLILGVGFCCAEPDSVDLGEDCGGFWIFGLGKPLSVRELFCRTLEEKITMAYNVSKGSLRIFLSSISVVYLNPESGSEAFFVLLG